jgi:hypothetical protein
MEDDWMDQDFLRVHDILMREEFDRPLRVAASDHESRVQISDFLRHASNPPAINIILDEN